MDNGLKRARNWFLFLLVVLVWSSNWAVMKSMLNYVTPLNAALGRCVLSGVGLSLLLILVRGKIRRDEGPPLRLLVLGIVFALSVASTYMGLVHAASGIGALLTFTQPLFVFCLSALFMRSEAKAGRLLGAFLGFSGVVVISIGKSSELGVFAYSELLLLIGAVLWAVAVVYYKIALSHVDPVLTNAVQQAVGVVVLAPLASLEGLRFPFVAPYMLMLFYSAVLATCMGQTVWLHLIREEDVTVLSSSSFLIPVVAMFLGWLILGENVEAESILGMGLILAGVYLVNKPESS